MGAFPSMNAFYEDPATNVPTLRAITLQTVQLKVVLSPRLLLFFTVTLHLHFALDKTCPTRPLFFVPLGSTVVFHDSLEEELEANEQCRGWICPKGHECAAHTPEPCKHDTCRISRTCHTPLITPATSTLTPKHSWRDDIKLSFYSKLDKNSSSAYEEDIFIPQPPTSSLAPIVQNDNKEVTNAMSGERSNTTVTYKSSIYEPPSSIPVSTILTPTSSSSTISSHEVQPTITSLSTWLNHLKQKTGVDAVEEWVQKSENNENFAVSYNILFQC